MTTPDNNSLDTQEYSGVVQHDDDEGSANSETPALPRRRAPPPHRSAASHFIMLAWLCLMGILGVGCIVLLRYKTMSHGSVAKTAKTDANYKQTSGVVHYDPAVLDQEWDPLDLNHHHHDRDPLLPPSLPDWKDEKNDPLGFLQQPDVVNNTLVFVSEGDLYWTRLLDNNNNNNKLMPAVKLTTTVGNVLTPKINPWHDHLIAYTATYHSRRDVYLLDLRSAKPAIRLTAWDTGFGVVAVVGWKDKGTTLVFAAPSNQVGLPHTRLYELSLQQDGQKRQETPVLQVEPVPLAQTVDGVYDQDDECLYFVRFKQTSHTIRYVGGTAESLWAWCREQELAVPILHDKYKGTTKRPQILHTQNNNKSFLLFLSDRNDKNTPTSMNLWAMPLPSQADLYDSKKTPHLVQLTNSYCQFNGLAVTNYAVDPVTANVILHIGADLYVLQDVLKQLQQSQTTKPTRLPIQVLSDFQQQQERLIPLDLLKRWVHGDVFLDQTDMDPEGMSLLMTLRGQVWVAPVLQDLQGPYQGAGQNLPSRRYRVVPGAVMTGAVRVLQAVHVPLPDKRRVAVVLATDPLSPTAEHAFYLVPIDSSSVNEFVSVQDEHAPFLGGHLQGGSTRAGGLGSVRSINVSPCGRRMAWTDKDGRICVMTLPLYRDNTTTTAVLPQYQVLPSENELGEPLDGDIADLDWSPGGRYLAIVHQARNQFKIISIVDCGNPNGDTPDSVRDIELGRIVQATPSRFNSFDLFWGKSGLDMFLNKHLTVLSSVLGKPKPDDVATTLYFLTDRDVASDVPSPWGTRAPLPHLTKSALLYALALNPVDGGEDALLGRFPGGGALELFTEELESLDQQLKDLADESKTGEGKIDNDAARKLRSSSLSLAQAIKKKRLSRHRVRSIQRYLRSAKEDEPASPLFPQDMEIEFGPVDLTFARSAYRIVNIPEANYVGFLSQTKDDGSIVLLEALSSGAKILSIFSPSGFPSDEMESTNVLSKALAGWGVSTSRDHVFLLFSSPSATNPLHPTVFAPRVIPNTKAALSVLVADLAGKFSKNVADTAGMALSVWPKLEFQQMYSDAWRMFRDYFYDVDMHGVDWPEVFERYKSLVGRCSKREELDQVLVQMASELSALHVFVYGGEYNTPFNGDLSIIAMHTPASLGATLKRSPEWKGYTITEIPERDPDFNLMDGKAVYSPLSDRALRPTGQRGLAVGDVIVGINGESVLSVPDINLLLRGLAGRSVRLQVLRLASGSTSGQDANSAVPEPVVTVPITPDAASKLRYDAWEWNTRKKAQELAAKAGFTVGYIHLQDMGHDGTGQFVRNFFPDYDKQALILDLRNNGGGNIDSWILTYLQKKVWFYFGARNGIRNGEIDWDEQFAFRGHVVVLINEHTSSDAEGVSRGISELGLGRLVGMRTWGGGIWLSSDNHLVDGGIATAPEIGTFNEHISWGMGIEQQGVSPDVEVDNNPRTTYDGEDAQLERAIAELKQWLREEPVVEPKVPGPKPNMALKNSDCPA